MLQLTEEIGKLEDKVECANNALKADWERWKQNMQNDLKSAFTDTAEENIRYYEQVSRGSRKPFLVKRCALGCLSALCKDSRGKSQLSPSKASLVTSCWVVSLPPLHLHPCTLLMIPEGIALLTEVECSDPLFAFPFSVSVS